jgi:hypothetical protein
MVSNVRLSCCIPVLLDAGMHFWLLVGLLQSPTPTLRVCQIRIPRVRAAGLLCAGLKAGRAYYDLLIARKILLILVL